MTVVLPVFEEATDVIITLDKYIISVSNLISIVERKQLARF